MVVANAFLNWVEMVFSSGDGLAFFLGVGKALAERDEAEFSPPETSTTSLQLHITSLNKTNTTLLLESVPLAIF